MNPKLYLCGMTSAGQENNLVEMINPIKSYLDGINFVFHIPKDEGGDYLENNKKNGKIIYTEYAQRHHFSMNHFLYQGTMKDGDNFLLLDSYERLSPKFFEQRLPSYLAAMAQKNIAMVANEGKGLLFRYNENLEFKGSPHWFITNLDGSQANIKLPNDEFWSTRNQQRDLHHFVNHYAKYYLFPAGSNHSLLGLDHHVKGNGFFQEREEKRLQFREEMRNRGFPLTVDGLKQMLSAPLDDKLKEFINFDLILNNFYSYNILNDLSITDKHDWNSLKKF